MEPPSSAAGTQSNEQSVNMCKACTEPKVKGAKYCATHKRAAQAVHGRLRAAKRKDPKSEDSLGESTLMRRWGILSLMFWR